MKPEEETEFKLSKEAEIAMMEWVFSDECVNDNHHMMLDMYKHNPVLVWSLYNYWLGLQSVQKMNDQYYE